MTGSAVIKKSKISERSLLAAKLSSPAVIPTHVLRVEICDAIIQSPSCKVILIGGPAGFGKSTAMAQARSRMEDKGIVTSWLTLDSGDNDASRFLSYLSAAVAKISPSEAGESDQGQPVSSMPLGDFAFSIVNRIAKYPFPFALFLDDIELIQAPAVLSLVREVIDHLPRSGQVVIGSRSLPDLKLGRLRAHGQLLELDASNLRFSVEDTEVFFVHQGLHLISADVRTLHRKTEGWVAALWLVSMALARRDSHAAFIEEFSGSDQAITDYLAEDVLARQPAHIRDFLVRTSILRQLNPQLCDAICGRTDSSVILRELGAANLFLTPIEGSEGTFRYHSLFGGFLRAQLSRDKPAEIAHLHRLASGWYELHGDIVWAIDHALDGKDLERVLSLLAQHSRHFLRQGRMRLLACWFDALSDEMLLAYPILRIAKIWAFLLTRGPGEAIQLLEHLNAENSTDPEIRAHVAALRPLLLAMSDRYEDAHEIGRRSLEGLPTVMTFADSVLTNTMANVFSVMGRYGEARELLELARSAQGRESSAFNIMASESVEGIIDLQEGRMRQAAARFRMAVTATQGVSETGRGRSIPSYGYSNGNAWAGVLYAGALYEANEFDQAKHLLNVYMPLVEEVGLPDHMILGHVMLSRIEFNKGEVDEAFQILSVLEYLGHQRKLVRAVASAKLERARVLLLQGYGPAAKEELSRSNDDQLWRRVQTMRLLANDLEYWELGRLRWEISVGDAKSTLSLLEKESAVARKTSRNRRALLLSLLHALALQRAGEPRAALATLREVLVTACREGFVRLILDEGIQAGILLKKFEAGLHDDGSRCRDAILTEYVRRLIEAFGPGFGDETGSAASGPQGVLLEALTRSETRVLVLLATGYSNAAIAEKLFISDSTVRTHLRNINMKLDAHSRTQAVAIARSLKLID